VAAALCCAGCGAPLMKLPSGPGAPAADAADAIAEATAACRAISTISAEIAVSGSVGGQRLRGRLLAGLAPPASARLEAVAPVGPPVFIFVASGGDATLLLPRDDRILEHGPPAAVLEAVAGVPLDAAELRAALTGCAQAPAHAQGRAMGPDWRRVPDGPTELYLQRDRQTSRWRLVATLHHAPAGSPQTGDPSASSGPARAESRADWRAEYRDFQNGVPQSVHLVSVDGKRFDLTLALSQVEANVPLGPEVFRVQIPRSATPITLDELRDARPGIRKN
jgi:hypothetical protein